MESAATQLELLLQPTMAVSMNGGMRELVPPPPRVDPGLEEKERKERDLRRKRMELRRQIAELQSELEEEVGGAYSSMGSGKE